MNLSKLNEIQKEDGTTVEWSCNGNAGTGLGKARVLTYKVVYLV